MGLHTFASFQSTDAFGPLWYVYVMARAAGTFQAAARRMPSVAIADRRMEF
jgi:hypothetical protein